MRKTFAAVTVVLLGLSAMAAGQSQRGRGRGAAAPPSAPLTLEARLVVGQGSYDLPASRMGEPFRKQLQEMTSKGTSLPAPPDVDLTLELKNTGAVPVAITLDGDACRIGLKLEGPGAVDRDNTIAMTTDFRMGRPVTIDPGRSLSLPIKSLRYGLRGIAKLAYWTEPGEYTLTVSYTTHPPDLNDRQSIFEAPPVKIKVTASGKE